MFFLPISAQINIYIDLSGPFLAEAASTTNANFPGIQSLRGLDALIALEQVGETGGDQGRSTEAVRHWFSRKDDRVQGRFSEGRVRGTTTKPPSRSYGGCWGQVHLYKERDWRGGGRQKEGELQERRLNSILPIKVNPRPLRGSPSLGGTPTTHHYQVLPTA